MDDATQAANSLKLKENKILVKSATLGRKLKGNMKSLELLTKLAVNRVGVIETPGLKRN